MNLLPILRGRSKGILTLLLTGGLLAGLLVGCVPEEAQPEPDSGFTVDLSPMEPVGPTPVATTEVPQSDIQQVYALYREEAVADFLLYLAADGECYMGYQREDGILHRFAPYEAGTDLSQAVSCSITVQDDVLGSTVIGLTYVIQDETIVDLYALDETETLRYLLRCDGYYLLSDMDENGATELLVWDRVHEKPYLYFMNEGELYCIDVKAVVAQERPQWILDTDQFIVSQQERPYLFLLYHTQENEEIQCCVIRLIGTSIVGEASWRGREVIGEKAYQEAEESLLKYYPESKLLCLGPYEEVTLGSGEKVAVFETILSTPWEEGRTHRYQGDSVFFQITKAGSYEFLGAHQWGRTINTREEAALAVLWDLANIRYSFRIDGLKGYHGLGSENLGGIEPEDAWREIHPDWEPIHVEGGYYGEVSWDGTEYIYFHNPDDSGETRQSILSITTSDPAFETYHGVRVGKTVDELIALYNKEKPEYGNDDGLFFDEIEGYYWYGNEYQNGYLTRFYVTEELISQIQMVFFTD